MKGLGCERCLAPLVGGDEKSDAWQREWLGEIHAWGDRIEKWETFEGTMKGRGRARTRARSRVRTGKGYGTSGWRFIEARQEEGKRTRLEALASRVPGVCT